MKVVLYPNLKKKNAREYLEETIKVLSHYNFFISIDLKYKNFINSKNVNFGEFTQLINNCDIVIAIGGDGTILSCVKKSLCYDKPILGINTGRLGFMASVEKENLDDLKNLITKNYKIEKRMMLEILHINEHNKLSYYALNDIVIARPYSKIADFDILVDNKLISQIRADGLVFSTPTGSTAYSLSAGGPIIEPDIECIEFVPICSHSLFSRSIIFSKEKIIEVKISNKDINDVYLSVDGNESIPININDKVFIKKADKTVKLIDLKSNTFFDSVNRKLMQSLKGAD